MYIGIIVHTAGRGRRNVYYIIRPGFPQIAAQSKPHITHIL